jgi:protocatechuate 3,4-dioxygenase beta subunit
LIAACGGSAGSSVDAASSADAPIPDANAATWATGGTAAMTGKASYPNPFASGAATACVATCTATQGPCYDSASTTLQDISYGQDGLPVRYYFQLLDEECAPIAGATVDIWHVAPTGKYSGDDAANEQIAFCTDNDTTYTSALFFRGKQVTDANGLCFFDSCFPGWYSSRTIHVHFIITVNGVSSLTSQFFFDDTLDDEIVAGQPIYKDRGARDTTNATDSVISAAEAPAYSFETEQMPDGAMLAWKTIVVPEAMCALVGNSGSGGGPGGPGSAT